VKSRRAMPRDGGVRRPGESAPGRGAGTERHSRSKPALADCVSQALCATRNT